jgi:hypothetical protein
MRVVQESEPVGMKVDAEFGRRVEAIECEVIETGVALEDALDRLAGLHGAVEFVGRECPGVLMSRMALLKGRVAALVGQIALALAAQQNLTSLIDGLDIRKVEKNKEK